jgi:hypothetical protein
VLLEQADLFPDVLPDLGLWAAFAQAQVPHPAGRHLLSDPFEEDTFLPGTLKSPAAGALVPHPFPRSRAAPAKFATTAIAFLPHSPGMLQPIFA